MKVRYFEKRGNTWADFRLGGARKRMDTGCAWGDQKGAEAAMPALIARALAEQQGEQGGTTPAAALSNGPIRRRVANHVASGHTLKTAYKLALRVHNGWVESKDKKTIEQTFDAIIASTPKLTEETDVAVLTRDFVRDLRADWVKSPGKRKGTTLSHSTINHRLSMLTVLLEVCGPRVPCALM